MYRNKFTDFTGLKMGNLAKNRKTMVDIKQQTLKQTPRSQQGTPRHLADCGFIGYDAATMSQKSLYQVTFDLRRKLLVHAESTGKSFWSVFPGAWVWFWLHPLMSFDGLTREY